MSFCHAVGVDEAVVFFHQGDRGKFRLYICDGIHNGDNEFFTEIQRGLLHVHGKTGAEQIVDGCLIHYLVRGRATDFGNGEIMLNCLEGDRYSIGCLFAGNKADDSQKDEQDLFHNSRIFYNNKQIRRIEQI